MEVIAKARYIRMSPRKVRLLAGLIRGMDAVRAEAQLGFSAKAAARPVLKLLRSAIANAEHNHKLDRGGLFVKTITVDGGPVLKRWRARAHGRAAPIKKRTSHINIVLAEREGESVSGLKAALVGKKVEKAVESKGVKSKKPAKPAGKAKTKTARPAKVGGKATKSKR
ncbi:50S ribosomal protein L22 [Candidatus Uhrbacteria bacterium]|nr:50S ribosomal protein L22 [Candidatus Uhrbacteria bacterium]